MKSAKWVLYCRIATAVLLLVAMVFQCCTLVITIKTTELRRKMLQMQRDRLKEMRR